MKLRLSIQACVTGVGLALTLGACGSHGNIDTGAIVAEAPDSSAGNTPAPTDPNSGPVCASTDTFTDYGQAFMVTHCTACHPEYATAESVKTAAPAMLTQVTAGSMPLGAPLDEADKTRFSAWLNCGAP